MLYSKKIDYQGITIMFDKLIMNKEYPTFYIPTNKGRELPVFLPKRKLKLTEILKVSNDYSVVSYTFDE